MITLKAHHTPIFGTVTAEERDAPSNLNLFSFLRASICLLD